MVKIPVVKKKTKKITRLGHDPLDDLGVDVSKKKPESYQNTESSEEVIKMEDAGMQSILHLPSRFSIASISEVYEQMSSIMEQKQTSIIIDAKEVESIDTAALQLLFAFSEQVRISGKNLCWQPQSDKIKEASRILNIDILTCSQ